jgi:hypothetical protein
VRFGYFAAMLFSGFALGTNGVDFGRLDVPLAKLSTFSPEMVLVRPVTTPFLTVAILLSAADPLTVDRSERHRNLGQHF